MNHVNRKAGDAVYVMESRLSVFSELKADTLPVYCRVGGGQVDKVFFSNINKYKIKQI